MENKKKQQQQHLLSGKTNVNNKSTDKSSECTVRRNSAVAMCQNFVNIITIQKRNIVHKLVTEKYRSICRPSNRLTDRQPTSLLTIQLLYTPSNFCGGIIN